MARPPARNHGGKHQQKPDSEQNRHGKHLGGGLRLHPCRRPAQTAQGSHGARFRIRHPHPCGSRLYRCEDRRTQRLHQGGAAQRRHRKHHHRQNAEAQSRLAQLRRDGKGPQQNQGVPARRGGQSGPVRTRGARTQTEKLETQHSN